MLFEELTVTIRPVLFMALACALLLPAQQGGAAPDVVRKLLDIEFEPVSELSGMVRSHRYEGVYWVHNDSGDSARVFALDDNGRVIFPAYLSQSFHGETIESGKQEWPGLGIELAANIDWEDIALDDGKLYIAEMGNNGNARRDLGIYVVAEPNPREIFRTRPLKFVPVAYPDQQQFPARQWHYDSEALFVDDGVAYVLTKHRRPGKHNEFESGTVLYRLPTMKTNEVNLLERVEARADVAVVTAADLSPDGRYLAVLCYRQLWVFERPREGDRWLSAPAQRLDLSPRQTGQIEAVTWRDAGTILMGNEGREWFTVRLEDVPRID